MERVCEELDEAICEIEKLRENLKQKTEFSENLKKAHSEQQIQIQEASSKFEKQAQELSERAEELSAVKQMCEDLQCSLKEKESAIRHLSTANDKLRVDFGEKYQKWEEERRALSLALDEANEKNIDQEQKIHVFMAEVEGLKGLISASQKMCMEVEKKAKAPKELRDRDDMLLKLEDENRKIEDQLKWKKEQFKYLEAAHQKLRDQFRESKKEWEQEKSTLIDEICSLQKSLDSQTRISEDLQNRLRMCNQALAHEESRRKYLEVEVSDFKTRFENVFADYQDAKSQLDCLSSQRDKEIAALRQSLGTKETFYKEIEYRAGKLEQENQELLASLKELQEAQIKQVGNSSSLAKLRNKLRSLEQMHRDCSANLRAKEAEWSSQTKKLTGELNNCRYALESKESAVKELEVELENCYSAIMQSKLQNEEASVMLLVLKAGITEAQLNLGSAEAVMSLRSKERDESVSRLMQQLEMKNIALAKALADVNEERQKVESLSRRIESLDLIEEQWLLMQKELERCKEMLEESSQCHIHFKEQAMQTKCDLEEKIRAVCDALDMANSELAREREKIAFFSQRAASLNHIEEKWVLIHKELERYKEILEESSRCQLRLEEQALQIESDSKEKFREFCDALDMAIFELAEQREETISVSRRAESFNLAEEQHLLVQKELEGYKEMLEESSRKQLLLGEKALRVETDLKKKLAEVCDALDTANSELAAEREKAASLSRRVVSFDVAEEKQLLMQKELEKYKEMLEEASRCQLRLEKQALQKEMDSKEKLQEARDALDRLNSVFATKVFEGHAVVFELWLWQSITQRLKGDLEESQALRKELEASLLAQAEVEETIKQEKDGLARMLEVKESRIHHLQQQIELFEKEIETRESAAASSARMESVTSFESEKESFLRTMREKEMILEDLQKEIGWLEQESLRREFEGVVIAQIGAERTFEPEKENLLKLVQKKDQRIDELFERVRSLEQNFNTSLVSFSAELAEKQADINLVHEAWEKIAAAEILAQLEIEEKKLMIAELEDDIYYMQQKLELHEKSSSCSKQKALAIEAELKAKQLEMRKFVNVMETKLKTSESLVDELKSEKRNLVEDVMKLSSERQNILSFAAGVGDRINQFSSADTQLMETLERMMKPLDDGGSVFKSVKENVNTTSIPSPMTTKKLRAVLEERSPFRELN